MSTNHQPGNETFPSNKKRREAYWWFIPALVFFVVAYSLDWHSLSGTPVFVAFFGVSIAIGYLLKFRRHSWLVAPILACALIYSVLGALSYYAHHN